jgi:hypothetical protein
MTGDARVPPSPFEIGLEAMREGRVGDALHAFEQAYHLTPHDPRLHEAVGQLFFNMGNTRRAHEYLEYAIHLDPQAPGPRYQLALVLLHEGRASEAHGVLQSVLALDPDHGAARAVLEAEERRRQRAERLPFWQPRRRFGEEIVLRPPTQVAPYGRSHPAPLRAPHHCVNCYFRPGRQTERVHAYRYHLWNLGLVGMLFGGWPVYVIWSLIARERRFSFEPLYCSVCGSHRRVLYAGLWLLVGLAILFAFAGFVAVLILGSAGVPSSTFAVAFPTAMAVLCAGSVAFALWCRASRSRQCGARMRVVGENEVGFSFSSAQYAGAFTQLNGAFIVRRPEVDTHAEADSFLPEAAEMPKAAAPASPGGAEPAEPPLE